MNLDNKFDVTDTMNLKNIQSMINLPRYQEKGILLSYALNPDVAEIIIDYLKVADQSSEIMFREKNQEIFKEEYDWSSVMYELTFRARLRWLTSSWASAPMMPTQRNYYTNHHNRYTQINQVGFRVRSDRVRNRYEVQVPAKKVPFTPKVKHGKRPKLNHHKRMNRSNRMITKHMNNR